MSARSGLASWFASAPPSVAVEVGARRVSAVALGTAGGRPTITAQATERLPDGAVVPALTTPNVVEREVVVAAVRKVLGALGTRTSRVALVIPDGAAKVSLVHFEKLPERAADLDQLVRWQVKKNVAFPLDQAQVAWTRGVQDGESGVELVVTIVRHDIVTEYEQLCKAAGAHAGLVDLATFNLVNLVLASQEASAASGDWLLVHVCPDSSTMAIVRDGALLLFRNRPEGEGSLADLVHQTTMYYEDRLGGRGLARVLVAPRDLTPAQADDVSALVRTLEGRLGGRVREIDPRAAAGFADGLSATSETLRALAAPVGILVREQVV